MNPKTFEMNEKKKEFLYNVLLEEVLSLKQIIEKMGLSKESVKFMLNDMEKRGSVVKTKHMDKESCRYMLFYRSTLKKFKPRTVEEFREEKRTRVKFGMGEFFNPFVKAPNFETKSITKHSMDKPACPYKPIKRKTVVSIGSSFESCI